MTHDDNMALGLASFPLAVNIYVDEGIRHHLGMKNGKRKARVYLPKDKSKYPSSQKNMRDLVEKRLDSLLDQPYVLRYKLDDVSLNGASGARRFHSDNDVLTLFRGLDSTRSHALNLYIDSSPQFPPRHESYLQDMTDPADSEYFTMLSFYRFGTIENPDEFAELLELLWKPFKAFGRVYVATEGVNAQCAIPTNVLPNFIDACLSVPFFRDLHVNTDRDISRDDYEKEKPFKAMHIRVRTQIVADGFTNLDTNLDWTRAGSVMDPHEWHEAIDNPNAVVLDCRNGFESDVGIFNNAVPLGTTFFRESWDAIDDILKDKPKDTQVYTYCTGGIRCVKTSAYIEQKLGFRNVHQLKGGIIGYTREMTKANKDKGISDSKFRGVNYVFDERMQARVTSDILSSCETCGEPCDSYTNCADDNCHIRFIQCMQCRGSYTGCCSLACQQRHKDTKAGLLSRGASKPKVGGVAQQSEQSESITMGAASNTGTASQDNGLKDHATSLDSQLAAISSYCEMFSSSEPTLLNSLRQETEENFGVAARMLSGPLQGRLLAMLGGIKGAKRCLELGTFTGYSALCLAESGADVITCEIDVRAANIAKRYFEQSKYSNQITLEQSNAFDLLNKLREEKQKFDIVFIDADKRAYIEYLETLLDVNGSGGQCLLEDGALIVVDNTLWKGLVMDNVEVLSKFAPRPELYGDVGRMKKLAGAMHDFNAAVKTLSDDNSGKYGLETVMLPLRDGLTVIRFTGLFTK